MASERNTASPARGAQWTLKPGDTIRRRDLHARYGGQRQGGIITPAGQPLIFVITGEGGAAHGYADGWDEAGTFRYYGEGQVGDMQFVRGNAAVRDWPGPLARTPVARRHLPG